MDAEEKPKPTKCLDKRNSFKTISGVLLSFLKKEIAISSVIAENLKLQTTINPFIYYRIIDFN